METIAWYLFAASPTQPPHCRTHVETVTWYLFAASPTQPPHCRTHVETIARYLSARVPDDFKFSLRLLLTKFFDDPNG